MDRLLCRMEGEEAALGPRLQRLHHSRVPGPPAHQVTILESGLTLTDGYFAYLHVQQCQV